MPKHPTQIFLSNPQALRVEYRLDDQCLELWWSPLAGKSTDCVDRNYSSRDAHLNVFASISIPGCNLESFLHCDYDPYHSILYFAQQTLHLAIRPDLAAVFVYCEKPQSVDFKTSRGDQITTSPNNLFVSHREDQRQFEFTASVGPGAGSFRHGPTFAPEYPRFSRAELSAHQLLVIGVGLIGENIEAHVSSAAAQPFSDHLKATNLTLSEHEARGHIIAPQYPELEELRRSVIRGLHSMIDESAAYRASLKAIYYLIWVRDGGFSFPYQAAAGWPHKLPEFCHLLLDNPLSIRDANLPNTRMFGQLVNRNLGKLEEDGLYYVVWTLFTQWTQNGHLNFMNTADWELIDEALKWVETVTWDEQRGLFGNYTADETPAHGSRDDGWDHAIGQPSNSGGIRYDGQAVPRNYDVYFNICMHSTYCMLAAMRQSPHYLTKTAVFWPELLKLLNNRKDGIPTYGELLMLDGRRIQPPYWGPACGASCCVWGLSMPNFAPLADWDNVHTATLDAIIAKPDMHFVNGICSAMSAVDPWCYDEAKLISLHQRLAKETNTPGTYLPMGGAMPEKFNAPQGNLYHDIRPQGFAMGAWLAAWSSLGLRRLPYGLALRPTGAFERIENYTWRGSSLTLHYGPIGHFLALKIDGESIEGTLQIPQSLMGNHTDVHLEEGVPTPLWLRSSVQLDSVSSEQNIRTYVFSAYGLSSITFSGPLNDAQFTETPNVNWTESEGLHTAHFTHFGTGTLSIKI